VVEQLFIRNPAEEAAMLHHLRERLAVRDMLVSYNGKCFDWPILKNRYILNRQKDGATDPVHFDFLYPSRSLWRNTLPSCRLSSVERERLGLSRIDDVPGSLAPALYFQYLAEGDPALVAGVFEHNEKDVLTLACLAVHLTRLMAGTVSTARMEPEELFRLALWLDKVGRAEEADEAFRELLGRDSDQASDYWLPAADFYKRQGRFEPAVSLWERTIERKRRSRIAPLTPYVELAMYYEHQQKDYDRALEYAEQAFEKARGRLTAVRKEGGGAEEIEAIRKRVDRLMTKRDTALQRRNARPKPASAKRGGKGDSGVWQQMLPIAGDERRYRELTERRTESI
jgi:tetratricopeptide (TPR) repeat protein